MDIGSLVQTGAVLLLFALFVSAPVVIALGLINIAFRRMSGRRGPFDRLFGAIGRAGAMNWHLTAGGQHPDDIGAVPPGPGPRPRGRRRS